MPGNTFGSFFRITTWGESHGPALGVVIDGCPPGIVLNESIIQPMMDRRKPGSSAASTSRREPDCIRILSGVFEGRSTGTPISILIENADAQSRAYAPLADVFRPGHGDFTYEAKYGIRDWRGGGRASARETSSRVAAGAVAAEILKTRGVRVRAYTLEIGGIRAQEKDLSVVTKNSFLCPDMSAAEKIARRIDEVRKAQDSVGGIVEVLAQGIPAGLGEPVFDKMDADLAKALMSIGAVKGVEIGSGFQSARMLGSEHNDPISENGFLSNHAGGILAGITSGQDIVVRAAVKPIPSIGKTQHTIDRHGSPTTIQISGRHDVCAIPRINVVCEAMVNLVLTDHILRQRAFK